MMDKTTKTLHFTFTPVQSFVAQARRTRDLWAGSYLLSWLAGQAMAAILKDGGEILIPDVVNDALIKAIENPSQALPVAKSLGSLPNRFTARIYELKDPNAYAQVIQDKWITVATAVRETIDPKKTLIDDAFWNRQIQHHWEFTWVIGEQSKLLESRKNLRVPNQTQESGEKCTMCGERQELFESTKQPPYQPDRKASKVWWAELKRSAIKHADVKATDLDLRDNERLCAVCLTKRLFPMVAKQAIGWHVERYYPSTAYLSAIDWLKVVLDNAKESVSIRDAANELTKIAEKIKIYKSEYNTHIPYLDDNIAKSGIDKAFIQLDGDVFYLSAIFSNQLEKRGSNEALSATEKQTLSAALKKLQHTVGGTATPFYALLLMDGDGMGKLLSSGSDADRKKIAIALNDFTSQVPGIVSKHNGRLVYAGGDDVFALLPISAAIWCAEQCRIAYRDAFKDFSPYIKAAATISAAVQFAHQNIALSVVVKDAHRLLDNIAKDHTGRDALACRVWKPGGAVLTWSLPWEIPENRGYSTVKLIEEVIKAFHPDSKTDRFSSKFFHKLGDLFELIESDTGLPEQVIPDVLVAEYLANREHNWEDTDQQNQRTQAEARIKRLLLLCQEQNRNTENQTITYKKGRYNADAALLVRFLVQKEV